MTALVSAGSKMRQLTTPPGAKRWGIRNARVPASLLDQPIGTVDAEGLCVVDIVIADGRIDAIAVAQGLPDALVPPAQDGRDQDLPYVAGAPCLVMPCFVDAHTHLDKGHIWPRTPRADGTRDRAIETVGADRAAHWTTEDVQTRMRFGLESAYAHGTAAIRTHIDSLGPQIRVSWPVLGEMRDAWRGRIDLQASPLFGIEFAMDDTHMRAVEEMVGAFGSCLGAVTYPHATLWPGLKRLFGLASDKGWDLDFHVDETGDPSVNTLAVIAQTALDVGFEGKVLAGHCCSLSIMAEEERHRTIDVVARAGVAVVSLPMCNMYLQDRGATTPRWRGTTALKELAAAGVPVVIASDNTRDPFYAYGDLDMAEVWREGTRILHLDHPFADWARTVAATPAEILRSSHCGRFAVGEAADFILFGARSLSEFMARPSTTRTVVRHGRPIVAEAPAYANLDLLQGLKP